MSHKRDRIDRTSKVDRGDPKSKAQTVNALGLRRILVVPVRVNKMVQKVFQFRGTFLLIRVVGGGDNFMKRELS